MKRYRLYSQSNDGSDGSYTLLDMEGTDLEDMHKAKFLTPFYIKQILKEFGQGGCWCKSKSFKVEILKYLILEFDDFRELQEKFVEYVI